MRGLLGFVLVLVLSSVAYAAEKDWTAQPFKLRGTDGKERSLADYRGKVVVLEFFASWCEVCADSVPEINELAMRYPGKLDVVAVATAEDDPHGLETFIDENKPKYTILIDETDAVARQYRVVVFPTYYVIDREGQIQSFRRGPVNWDSPKVHKFLESLFAEAATAPAPSPMPAPVTTVSLP